MLDKNEILSNKIHIDTRIFSGVYFLIKRDKIVYVGYAKDVLSRLRAHRSNVKKRFDSFFYIDTMPEGYCLKSLEKYYIELFKPVYNFQFNPDFINGNKDLHYTFLNHFKSYNEVADITGVSNTTVRNIVLNETDKSYKHYDLVYSTIMNRSKKKVK